MALTMPDRTIHLGQDWLGHPLPPLPQFPNPLSKKLAQLANAACTIPALVVKHAEPFGLDAQLITAAVIEEATLLFKRMEPRLEPDTKYLRQQLRGEEPDTPIDSPVPASTKPVRKVTRCNVFGYSITAVLRWMGLNKWTFEDAAVVCASCGAASIADVTIRLQLKAGRDGERGPPAPITASQAKQLLKMAQ